MLYRIVLILIQIFVRPFLKITWIGLENIPSAGPFIVASDHHKYWDVLLLALTFAPRKIHFLAKAEFFRRKLIAMSLKALDAFPVKRGTADFVAMGRARRILNKGGIVGIFPEETLILAKKPPKPRQGAVILAVKSGSWIVPVKINYNKTSRFFPKATILCCKPIKPEKFGFNRQRITEHLQNILQA